MRKGMIRALLGGCCPAQQHVFFRSVILPFRCFVILSGGRGADCSRRSCFYYAGKPNQMHCFQHRASHRQCAGLIQDDGIQVRQTLQGLSALEQHAQLRTAPHGNRKCSRNREAHGAGQAMTRTATVLASASEMECLITSHTTNVISASPRTTGTKMALARSARRSMGARDDCACSTMRVICARTVASPSDSARHTTAPS